MAPEFENPPAKFSRCHYRSRHRHASDHGVSSPVDSGYGSADESSHDSSPISSARSSFPPSLDGTVSTDQSDSDAESPCSSLPDREEQPSKSVKQRPLLTVEKTYSARVQHTPDPSGHGQQEDVHRITGGLSQLSLLRDEPRISDRFVPLRSSAVTLAERYHTTCPVQSLSASERLLRRNTAPLEPFLPRRTHRSHVREEGRNNSTTLDEHRDSGHGLGTDKSATAQSRQSVELLHPVQELMMAVDIGEDKDDIEKHQGRLATALGIDQTRRMLEFDQVVSHQCRKPTPLGGAPSVSLPLPWNTCESIRSGPTRARKKQPEMRTLPVAPFKVLDAPNLRDDFYCSILAYSPVCQTLAIGLGNILYTWSEDTGVRLMHGSAMESIWLTSVGFSSTMGEKCILAIGRSDGSLVLKSTQDGLPRFNVRQPHPIACLSWRPICSPRPSGNPLNPGATVQTEELVVGDETGVLYYYVVEWPLGWEVSRDTWPGSLVLVAKISIHTQQICGLAWSPDSKTLASGGNDNLCCLFDVSEILESTCEIGHGSVGLSQTGSLAPVSTEQGDEDADSTDGQLSQAYIRQSRLAETMSPVAEDDTAWLRRRQTSREIRTLTAGYEKHCWIHGAAVKAIAFCPWREGLVATGGGSNDKCIHFFHAGSGTALATISVSAQVTSLIWSKTRREIAATFGYAQPDHPYRLAVFSWPSCAQVAAIPWDGELRALYAIPYPSGPSSDPSRSGSRIDQEGCIVVASSDESVKFHEIWTSDVRATIGGPGTLAGSDILEGLEGIDKDADIIR